MQFIVLDLEWNQPTNYQSPVFRKVGDSLLFEVIQIGAAKLNDRFELIDSANVLVRPTHYTTIHPRVRRMTHLGQEQLCDAPEFCEAMDTFLDWCGEDCAFLTWGGDDISVLQQNVDFFRYERPVPKMFDVQRYFAKVFELGTSQKALKTAMEQLGVEEDENRCFHNAMHDAYYTALVFQKLPNPAGVLQFEQQPRKLSHNARRSRFRVTHMVRSVTEALQSDKICAPECPGCKKPMALETAVIPQAVGKFVALAKCAQHGQMLMKIAFSLLPDGQKGMHLSVLPANRQSKAYVHTKELQYQFKKKRGDYDNADPEDVARSFSSNMPFEDA